MIALIKGLKAHLVATNEAIDQPTLDATTLNSLLQSDPRTIMVITIISNTIPKTSNVIESPLDK
ncbi:unnamed protein product [Schistosoma mattheei]|uniref:Uncharacterized protein n=1 Tax=Schistosoma mattheei TaxID=31246 RepID=A0A3P8K813_9TREM|nr:unnamed protein product [Schistosoma mattheei]